MAIFGALASKPATIATGTAVSDAVDLGSSSLVGLATPAGWTTAVITFQVSIDGTTYFDYETALGAEVTLASTAASRYRALDPADLAGVRYLKVRSGTSAAPVNQTGGDVIQLVTRKL